MDLNNHHYGVSCILQIHDDCTEGTQKSKTLPFLEALDMTDIIAYVCKKWSNNMNQEIVIIIHFLFTKFTSKL